MYERLTLFCNTNKIRSRTWYVFCINRNSGKHPRPRWDSNLRNSVADRGFESHMGLGFFPEFPFDTRNVSYFQIKTFYLSDANYPMDNPSQMNNPSLKWKWPYRRIFFPPYCYLPPPCQELVQTRESWKIQRKGNNVLAAKRKRVLVRKTRLLVTFLSVLSVVTVSFLFQIHLFILWQNSRIVASRLRCSSRIHFSTQSVQNCLLFPSFCEMKALEVQEHRGSFTTS